MDNSNNQNLTRYIHTVLAKLSASGGGGGDEPSSAKIEFVDTLPTASEDTVGIFYVIPNPDGNTGTIHITQNDGSTYSWVTVRDPETANVQYTQQTLTEAQKQQARNNIDAASLADIENLDYVTAATLPTASAETMGHVYLIGPDASNNYQRYYTQQNGSSYSWVDLGSTQLDLSTYATEAEVIQLEAKVSEIIDLGTWNIGSIAPGNSSISDYASTTRLRMASQKTIGKSGNYKIVCSPGYLFLIYVAGKISTATWTNSRMVSMDSGDIYRIAIKTEQETDFSNYTQEQVNETIIASGIRMYGDVAVHELIGDVTLLKGKVNQLEGEADELGNKEEALESRVDELGIKVFEIDSNTNIPTTAGTSVDSTIHYPFFVVPNMDFVMRFTDNDVLPSGGSISVYFYDAAGTGLNILVDGVTKNKASFSASVTEHTIKTSGRISYITIYTSSSSTPTSDAGMSLRVLQGTNTINQRLTAVESGLSGEITERKNADAELQDGQTIVREVSPSSIANCDIISGTITTGQTAQHSVLHLPVSVGDNVRVTLTNTSTTNKGYYGYTTSLPANGVSVNGTTAIREATQIDWTATADGYFVIAIHSTYHKNVKMYSVVNVAAEMVAFVSDFNRYKTESKRNADASVYDNKVLNILYSVIAGIPGNTEAHFLDGIRKGFNGLKADMRMTSDGKIVLCHDAGYTFDGNGRITSFDSESNTPIHDYTLSEITALEFAEQVDGQYVHPCTLDRFLFICKKYGVVPYITIRWDDYRVATLAELYSLLKKYSLVDKVIINLFTGAIQWATMLRNTDDTLMRCNTLTTSNELSTGDIDACEEWGCNYVCVSYTNISSITSELVNYAFSKGVRVMVYGIHTTEEYDECVQMGVVGFQNYSRTAGV